LETIIIIHRIGDIIAYGMIDNRLERELFILEVHQHHRNVASGSVKENATLRV